MIEMGVIRVGIRKVPVLAYAFGLAVIAACLQLAIRLAGGNKQILAIGVPATIAVMILLYLVTRLVAINSRVVLLPIQVLVWAVTIAFVIALAAGLSAVIIGVPKNLHDFIFPIPTTKTEPNIGGVKPPGVTQEERPSRPDESAANQSANLQKPRQKLKLSFKTSNAKYYAPTDRSDSLPMFPRRLAWWSPTFTQGAVATIVETYVERLESGKQEAEAYAHSLLSNDDYSDDIHDIARKLLESKGALTEAKRLVMPEFDVVVTNPNDETIVLDEVEVCLLGYFFYGGDPGEGPSAGVIKTAEYLTIKIPSPSGEDDGSRLIKPLCSSPETMEPAKVPKNDPLRLKIVLDMSDTAPGEYWMALNLGFGDDPKVTREFGIQMTGLGDLVPLG